jgi:hypothetical protein
MKISLLQTKFSTADMRIEIKMLLALIVFLLSMHSGNAQLLTPLSPTNGEQNVGRIPSIQFQTTNQSHSIVTSSVYAQTPYCDTVNSCTPTALVIPQSVYTDMPDSLWEIFASSATITVPNSNTLKVQIDTSGMLDYFTSYVVVINNLRIVTAPGDTATCTMTFQNLFTTVHPPPTFAYSNINIISGVVCNQPLQIHFKSPLPGTHINNTPIVRLSKVDGISVYDTVQRLHNTLLIPVGVTQTLSTDGKTITSIPNGSLQPGESYVIHIDAGNVTGDSVHNRALQFMVKQSAPVNVRVHNMVLQEPAPASAQPVCGVGVHQLRLGETLTLDVPKYADDHEFVMWTCPEFNSIDGSTDPNLTLNLSCSELKEINITAMFRKIIVDTITITHLNPELGGTFQAFGFRDSLGNGTYTMNRREGGEMTLMAIPTHGIKFSHWTTGLFPGLNPNSPMLLINPRFDLTPIGRRFDFGIGFGPVPTNQCDEFKFCLNITGKQGFVDPLSSIVVANISLTSTSSTAMSGCRTFPVPPNTRTFDYDITIHPDFRECYEIESFWTNRGQKGGVAYGGEPIGFELPLSSTLTSPGDCGDELNVSIRQKKFIITVETLVENNGFLPDQYANNVEVQTSTVGPGVLLRPIQLTHHTDPNTGIRRLKMITQRYEYLCGQIAIKYPFLQQGSGYKLGRWICPDGNPVNNNLWCTVDGSATNPQTIRVPMRQNWRARYEFASDFRLDAIGVREKNGAWKWYSTRTFPTGAPIGFMYNTIPNRPNLQLPPHISDDLLPLLHRKYASYKFRFNKSPDKNSIYNGITFEEMESGRVVGSSNRRLDMKPLRTYTSSDYNIKFHDYFNDNNETIINGEVEFELKTRLWEGTYEYTCHLNKLKLRMFNSIRSVDNDVLQNPLPSGGIETRTGFPGFYLALRSVHPSRIWDNCWFSWKPDLRPHALATVVQKNPGTTTPQFNSDLSAYNKWDAMQDMNPGESYLLDKGLLQTPVSHLDEHSVPHFAMQILDEGNAKALDKTADFVKALGESVSKLGSTKPKVKVAGEVIKLLGYAMKASWFKCSDRLLAEGAVSGSFGSDQLWAPSDNIRQWLYGQPAYQGNYYNLVGNEAWARYSWLLGDM